VVDTVVFWRALTASRRALKFGSKEDNFLEERCRAKTMRIVVDSSNQLRCEYDSTCGNREAVSAALYRLQSFGGIVSRPPRNAIPTPARGKLLALGFVGTCDKLVVRIALAGLADGQPHICSDDSDFWDPANTSSVGDHLSVVCRVLEDDLELRLLSHNELLQIA